MSRLQVHVNGGGGGVRSGGVLTTPEFGGGNAIARHGIHGVQWSFEFPIRGYLLQEGENRINITQTRRASGEFLGVIHVRLHPPGRTSRILARPHATGMIDIVTSS
jgi:rhamnogalacturonan endolyase